MSGFHNGFREFLTQAADSTDAELAGFDFDNKPFLEDELRTQYITYIYSCTTSSLLRKAQISPVIAAGYSMGIYAALFDSGSVSLKTGLTLIRIAYQCLHGALNSRRFGMGSLIGLTCMDIQQLIDQSALRVEITNQNASHSFVVSGYQDDIQKLMELAKEEGALHTRDLAVSIPYHSSYLKEGAMEFARQISHLEIGAPKTPLISLIDQISLDTPEIIRQEIIRNLFHPLNWFRTMQAMLERHVSLFVECGPSEGLARNARFVEGIRFSPLPSILPLS
jgi:[acyl-carrier-protein] S-malonyltransferase